MRILSRSELHSYSNNNYLMIYEQNFFKKANNAVIYLKTDITAKKRYGLYVELVARLFFLD